MGACPLVLAVGCRVGAPTWLLASANNSSNLFNCARSFFNLSQHSFNCPGRKKYILKPPFRADWLIFTKEDRQFSLMTNNVKRYVVRNLFWLDNIDSCRSSFRWPSIWHKGPESSRRLILRSGSTLALCLGWLYDTPFCQIVDTINIAVNLGPQLVNFEWMA